MKLPENPLLTHLSDEPKLRRTYDQLQLSLRAGLIATWFWDVDQDKVYGDPFLLDTFGIDSDQASDGLPLTAFTNSIHDDDRNRVIGQITNALSSGQLYEADFRIATTAAEPRWVLARGQASYDEQGNSRFFSGVLIDVTDRKKAELHSQATENRLRLAIESAQLGTWDYDPRTGELRWSDRTKELFGLPPTAPVDYQVFLRGLHPDDRERVDEAFRHSLHTATSGHFEIEYRTIGLTDGRLRWLRTNGQTITDEQKAVSLFIGTIMEITPVKQTEAILNQLVAEQTLALERQTHQLRTTLDASLNSIIAMTAIRDNDGTIIDFMMDTANEAVIKSNFMTPEQIIGRPLLTVFPGNRENGFFDLYVRVVQSGQPEQSSQYYQDEFGLEGWFEVSAVKQGDDGVVVTYNNITDRKRNELAAQQQANELREANNELRRSNENLQQFAHIASHDLQEPLRRIQAFSDLLQSQFADSLSDGEKDMTRRIQKSARRMQLLIKDLLAYSQLTTQREPFSPVSLTDVLNDVTSDLEMSITEKQATIETALLPTVLGSASRLRQLFQNLIVNALKFAQPDQPPLIQIRSRPAQADELPSPLDEQSATAFWLVTVADNGIGFEEKYKSRIFTPFQRLHDQATYTGTGIGLAICQRVAESHGGAIDVSSQPGSGSTFKVFLPVLNGEVE